MKKFVTTIGFLCCHDYCVHILQEDEYIVKDCFHFSKEISTVVWIGSVNQFISIVSSFHLFSFYTKMTQQHHLVTTLLGTMTKIESSLSFNVVILKCQLNFNKETLTVWHTCLCKYIWYSFLPCFLWYFVYMKNLVSAILVLLSIEIKVGFLDWGVMRS